MTWSESPQGTQIKSSPFSLATLIAATAERVIANKFDSPSALPWSQQLLQFFSVPLLVIHKFLGGETQKCECSFVDG